jgi:hypothetical protein
MAFKTETDTYPKSDFQSPVAFPLKLSGTFAELRPDHFHGGLDIKPLRQGVQGDAILAAAEGYISRIIVSAHDYGNAVYVTHPNGYTSIYAHLQRFTDDVAAFVLQKQYSNKSFELDELLENARFPVTKGQQIGYLGTTGSSFAPHLHFEIYETETNRFVNPLFFGFEVADKIPPFLQLLKVYTLNQRHETLTSQEFSVKKITNDNYTLPNPLLEISAERIGLGLKAYDLLTGTSNFNGIFAMDIYVQDSLIFNFEMDKYSAKATRYINAHLDYEHFILKNGYIHRGYRLAGNPLPIYKKLANDGVIKLYEQPQRVRIVCRDFAGNATQLNFAVKRAAGETRENRTFNYLLPYDEASLVRREGVEVYFPKNCFYENVYAHFLTDLNRSEDVFSVTAHLHEPTVPIHTPFEIRLLPNRNFPKKWANKLYIAQCKNGGSRYIGGKWQENWLTAEAKSFGDFTILLDTLPPKIRAIDFNGAAKPSRRLAFKITDAETGVRSYSMWIDGEWVLARYDAKLQMLVHQFEERLIAGQHSVEVIVTDKRLNTAIFKQNFIK